MAQHVKPARLVRVSAANLGRPIPRFYCQQCNHSSLTGDHSARRDVFEQNADACKARASELLPEGFKCPK